MRVHTPALHPAWRSASHSLMALGCALALTMAPPVSATAAGDIVTVKLKPMSSTFPQITSNSVRIDLSFTGKHKGKSVKQLPLRIDLVDLSHDRERSFSLSGAGISLIIPDPELESLAIKQLSIYDFKGTQLVYMRGKETACIKQATGENLLAEMEDGFSPESLMGGSAMTEFKGRLVRTESVFGIPARRYEITDENDRGTFTRMDVWVAVRGGYLIKIEAVETVKPEDSTSLVRNFDGEMRFTYAIFGINKTPRLKLPAECRNELAG